MADARDDELRARYRALATEEPSAALDDAIRAAARRAVASAPGGPRRSISQRWAVPASLAAVLFLSFGVVMHMQQETPSVEAELRGAPLPAAPSAVAPPPAKPEARVAEPQAQPPPSPPPKVTADIARDRPSEVAIAPMLRKEKKVVDAAVAPGPAHAPAAAPAPSAPPMKQEALKEPVPSAQESGKRDAAPARAAASPAPRPFSDTAAPPRATMEERNLAPLRREDEAGAATEERLAASRAKTESFAAKPAEASPSVVPAAPAAPATASTALRAQGRAAASGFDRLAPWPDTPEKKLERIEELRKAGRDPDADEAIARFRREHPDYRIPEDVWNRIKPR